jgi:hypothetical protein
MKKFKHMNVAEFNQIHSLVGLNLKTGQIMNLTGRTAPTISYVKRSHNFGEYKKIVEGYNKAKTSSKEDVSAEKSKGMCTDNTTIALLERIAIATEKLASRPGIKLF